MFGFHLLQAVIKKILKTHSWLMMKLLYFDVALFNIAPFDAALFHVELF